MALLRYLFHATPDGRYGASDRLLARWLFLRALGLIYLSAFASLLFQIRGLIGPEGILPAGAYLDRVRGLGGLRLWFAPTLFWLGSGPHALMAVTVAGLLGALLLTLNLWPRAMLAVCWVCFLSFVAAGQDFANYQSDGMLLEAGLLSLFLAPGGLRPGRGAASPPPRAAVLLLLWEWFRIYFESGAVKLLSGDPAWRSLHAMDEYYQNGPLPTWIGWYVQHLPEWFHRSTAALTLLMELGLVFLALLPRRWRIACFGMVTAWQAGVILTANYAFLNYLVLALGVLLLDDGLLERLRGRLPGRRGRARKDAGGGPGRLEPLPISDVIAAATPAAPARNAAMQEAPNPAMREGPNAAQPAADAPAGWRRHAAAFATALSSVLMAWIFYATTFLLAAMFWPSDPLPAAPVTALEPFRVANQYGLFAVMTPHRYEIEFQGSMDGAHWRAYPFRFKPQALNQPPGLYAPYQPRFDWNLWFASLSTWTRQPIVPRTEVALLVNDRAVLALFAGTPFPAGPPRYVRAVLWQYWFTGLQEKRATGNWWRRQLLGTYAPTLTIAPDGRFVVVQEPSPEGAPGT